MSDPKSNVEKACEAYWSKERYKKPKGNQKPENKVLIEHMDYFKDSDWFINRYESKAVKRVVGGKILWRQDGIVTGHPDLAGVTPLGVGAYLELKAPGKRSNLSTDQYSFLSSVISLGAFGIVSDSLAYTLTVYHIWTKSKDPKGYLMAQLPTQKSQVAIDSF